MPINARMLVQLKTAIPDSDLECIRNEFKNALLHIDPAPDLFYYDKPLIRIEAGDWKSTGTPLPAGTFSDGSNWLNANLCRAVYEPGYERGYLPLFIAAAEWLEKRIPRITLWYGNDSIDNLYKFTDYERFLLMQHWDNYGNKPYGSGEIFGNWSRDCESFYARVNSVQ